MVIQVLRTHHFSKELADFTQSKQQKIELLYWYKQAKISRITVFTIFPLLSPPSNKPSPIK